LEVTKETTNLSESIIKDNINKEDDRLTKMNELNENETENNQLEVEKIKANALLTDAFLTNPETETETETETEPNFNLEKMLFSINEMDTQEPIPQKGKKRFLPFLIGMAILCCLSIILIKIMPLAVFQNNQSEETQELIVTYTVNATQMQDGTQAQTITFYISGGKSVSLLGQSADVINGRATFEITNGVIEQVGTIIDDTATLQATIYGTNNEEVTETIAITSMSTFADFTLISPQNLSFESADKTFVLEAQLTTDSQVLINNQDFTTSIDATGLLSTVLAIDTTQSETIYNIIVKQSEKTDMEKVLTVHYQGEAETLLLILM
jgi:hypothetical protein